MYLFIQKLYTYITTLAISLYSWDRCSFSVSVAQINIICETKYSSAVDFN